MQKISPFLWFDDKAEEAMIERSLPAWWALAEEMSIG